MTARRVKATPGPWVVKGWDVYTALCDGDDPVAQVGMFVRAGRPWKEDEKEGQANARLIASSPDLLAACKEARAFCALRLGSHTLAVRLDAVIAKAEGH